MNFTLLVVVLLTAIAFVGVVIALSNAISPRSYNAQKFEAYECGIPTRGKSWMQFRVGYYLFAILFLIAAMIGWFLIFTYTFPLIGRFENSTKQTLKNAFGLAMSNMKATFALIIIDAFVAYCQSFVFKKVFEPYEAEQIAPENTEI